MKILSHLTFKTVFAPTRCLVKIKIFEDHYLKIILCDPLQFLGCIKCANVYTFISIHWFPRNDWHGELTPTGGVNDAYTPRVGVIH